MAKIKGTSPSCLALVLCAEVRKSRGGRYSVIEPFDSFTARSYPAETPPFSAWVQVTDGNGRLSMQLVCEQVPAGSLDSPLVLPIRFSLHFRNPNAVLEHVAVFHQGIVLPQEGRYRMRLTADGIPIKHRYFDALVGS